MTPIQTIIRAHELSKTFELSSGWGNGTVHALQEIEFSINRGECIGLLGPNGSGKSTLLRLIAGLSKPSSGLLEIQGSVGSLIHIASGLNSELTGRQNAELVLGIFDRHRKTDNRPLEESLNHMGITEFLDIPVKHYSNGMHLRLSFGLLTLLDFEIYAFDEVFHVGDQEFQETVRQYFHQLRSHEKTILIASHQLRELQLCDRIFTFSKGRIDFAGSRSEGIKRYAERSISKLTQIETQSPAYKTFNQTIRGITLHSITLSQATEGILNSEDALRIQLDFSIDTDQKQDPVLLIFDHLGQSIAMASPLFNAEPIALNTKRNRLSLTLPEKILGSDVYTFSLAFFPNLVSKLLQSTSGQSINWAEESTYFDTILAIKPQFRIGGQPLDISQMNLIGSFIISQAWEKE